MLNKKINNRAFKALLKGTKKIEIRTNKKNKSQNSFNNIKENDKIIFTNINTNEKLQATLEKKTLYRTIKELLETEGTKYSLSSTDDIDKGIKSIESIGNYKALIKKNGVFALKLKSVKKV